LGMDEVAARLLEVRDKAATANGATP